MFCITNKCDSDSKKVMFLIKMDDYHMKKKKKKCDTNKNMTKWV
jgi:hypothetical protein